MSDSRHALPPGQTLFPSFDRFGLGRFAKRIDFVTHQLELRICGDTGDTVAVGPDLLGSLPRIEQTADFHCVTAWSYLNLRWSGFRFADFYQRIVLGRARPETGATIVVLRGQDGYCCSMLLEDLLAPEVMLVDRLGGKPLGLDHGAPLRLIAPAHYGYKSVKHVTAIEFWRDRRNYRFPLPYPGLMDHPRGRVAYEERARFVPNWIIRPLYRLLAPAARRKHARALARRLAAHPMT